MKVESSRLIFLLTISFTIGYLQADGITKRQQCHDFAGDRSNCQRFIRCFYNLRVLFTCPSGTAYVPDLKTCVAKELVSDCGDSKNRDDIIITSNEHDDETDDYPTIEADLNSLEVPMQKSLSHHVSLDITSRQFGCSSFCYNKGVCVLVGQKITCRCPAGFIGVRCQVAQSAIVTRATCLETPEACFNGGICIDVYPMTFVCNCPAGFAGERCESLDTTVTATPTATATAATANPIVGTCPAAINRCQNGAACFLFAQGGFNCTCTPGFTGLLCDVSTSATGCIAGVNCQTIVTVQNQCQPNPCLNGGACYLNGTTFACACPATFTGTCCETSIALSNPCLTTSCLNSGTCQVVSATSFRCVCPAGLIGARCERRVCDPNPCLYGGSCLPLGSTFQCLCPAPYTGTCCELLTITTAAPNPCSSQPCLNGGTCAATSATNFVCSCPASYYGRCCEVRNYCQPGPCYNGGTCIPTVYGYLCQCPFPTTGSNCELTLTTIAIRPACPCVYCPCPTPSPTVFNPCLPNPCQNNGGCAVVQSTPQCYCQPAYTGPYCQTARHRSLINTLCANVTCLNGGECVADENGAQCSCRKSYFGSRCEQINRPRTCHPNPCGKYGQCVSTVEGYECVCDAGRTGILCEQLTMPKDYRWCPLDCQSGTTCVYEGNTPKCRVLNI